MNRLKKIFPYFFWFPSLLMATDAISKFIYTDFWNGYDFINSQEILLWVGIVEICIVLIFILPITQSAGNFLTITYWLAISTLSFYSCHRVVIPLIMLLLFALSIYGHRSTFLRYKSKCRGKIRKDWRSKY